VILMSAMLVAPACAARQWTHSLSHMIAYSAIIGAASGLVGAILSVTQEGIPTGPAIVLCLAAAVFVSLMFGSAQGLVWDRIRKSRRRFSEAAE
jgi:manganese/zinc/iron transport system permease protein